MKKEYFKKLKIFLFIVIAGLVVYVFRNQFPPIFKEMKNTSLRTLFLIALMGAMYQFFDGLSLREVAKSLGENSISVFDSWGCSLYSAFYRVITFGSATYLSIIYYFKRMNVDESKGFSISTLNYMAQRIAVVITASFMYIANRSFMIKYFSKWINYLLLGILFTLIVVLVLILICVSEKFHKLIIYLFKFDKKNRLEDFKNKLQDKLFMVRSGTRDLLLNKGLIVKITILNILKMFCWFLIPCIIFHNQYNYTNFDYISVTALAIALIGVIPAPGAMGSTEFVFGLLFSVLMDVNKAMSGMFLYRFGNFIVPTVLGALIAVYLRIKESKLKE